jgi:hypothetical protein
VVLCGVRDVRTTGFIRVTQETITGQRLPHQGRSLRLGDFTEADVAGALRDAYARDRQGFTPEALTEAWRLTQAQPWLVNAPAYETSPDGRRKGPRAGWSLDEPLSWQAAENRIRCGTHLTRPRIKASEERGGSRTHPGGEASISLAEDDAIRCGFGLLRRERGAHGE